MTTTDTDTTPRPPGHTCPSLDRLAALVRRLASPHGTTSVQHRQRLANEALALIERQRTNNAQLREWAGHWQAEAIRLRRTTGTLQAGLEERDAIIRDQLCAGCDRSAHDRADRAEAELERLRT